MGDAEGGTLDQRDRSSGRITGGIDLLAVWWHLLGLAASSRHRPQPTRAGGDLAGSGCAGVLSRDRASSGAGRLERQPRGPAESGCPPLSSSGCRRPHVATGEASEAVPPRAAPGALRPRGGAVTLRLIAGTGRRSVAKVVSRLERDAGVHETIYKSLSIEPRGVCSRAA